MGLRSCPLGGRCRKCWVLLLGCTGYINKGSRGLTHRTGSFLNNNFGVSFVGHGTTVLYGVSARFNGVQQRFQLLYGCHYVGITSFVAIFVWGASGLSGRGSTISVWGFIATIKRVLACVAWDHHAWGYVTCYIGRGVNVTISRGPLFVKCGRPTSCGTTIFFGFVGVVSIACSRSRVSPFGGTSTVVVSSFIIVLVFL